MLFREVAAARETTVVLVTANIDSGTVSVLLNGSSAAACGNGFANSGEACDDGNATDVDGCDGG